MKTIIYLFIISLMVGSLTAFDINSQLNNKIIVLKPEKGMVTPLLLEQSAKIISDRLDTYGLKEYNINVSADKTSIEVLLPENTDTHLIEGLLTSGGGLGFYETLELKKKSDKINRGTTEARPYCSGFEDKSMEAEAADYLRSVNHAKDFKLLWGNRNDKSEYCLYALKVDSEGKPLMVRSDIQQINSLLDDATGSMKISLRFKDEAKTRWADITGRNINKPIAIVVGDRVFYSPVVRVPIESGLCEISGDMTRDEINYFLSLVNNPPLPLKLEIIR